MCWARGNPCLQSLARANSRRGRDKMMPRRFPLVVVVALAAIAMGCGADLDDVLGGKDTSPPRGRSAKQPNTECFDSFSKFKSAKGRAGAGMHWHHIVGQHSTNERKFGKHDLNCTDNLVRLPRRVHLKVNGHYASKSTATGGKTVRDWLASKGFDEQWNTVSRFCKSMMWRHDDTRADRCIQASRDCPWGSIRGRKPCDRKYGHSIS